MHSGLIIAALFACLLAPSLAIYNINDYGAIRHADTHGAQIANQQAFLHAIQLANSTTTS